MVSTTAAEGVRLNLDGIRDQLDTIRGQLDDIQELIVQDYANDLDNGDVNWGHVSDLVWVRGMLNRVLGQPEDVK